MFAPLRNALISIAEALGPIIATTASELPTKALFSPALDNWLATTLVTNAVPPTFMPEYVANLSALSKSSPFQTEVAKVITAVTPKADEAVITPFTAS